MVILLSARRRSFDSFSRERCPPQCRKKQGDHSITCRKNQRIPLSCASPFKTSISIYKK